MKYKSKVDAWMISFVALLGAAVIFTGIVWYVWAQWYWFAVAAFFYGVLIVPTFFRTYYKLTDTDLVLNYGLFLFNHKIPYSHILELNNVRGFSDSVALSRDCIEVIYYKGKLMHRILISPKNRSVFCKELLEHVEAPNLI